MAKRKKSNKTLYILLGTLLLIVVMAVVAKSAGWIGQPRAEEVEVSRAKVTSITEKVSASGMVQPVTEVKISPDVAGEITELTVEEGDSVIQGELLVKIRPDNFIAAVEQAEAALNQQRANLASSRAALSRARATYTRSEADYKRQKKLWDEEVISEADWQLSEQNFEVAKNDLESAKQSVIASEFIVKSSKANLDQAKDNLFRTTVYAPVSGIVSKLSVEKGERVVGTAQMAGTEMLRIADLNSMEVRVDVNENDIVRVSLQDTALIDVDAYSNLDREFKGIVTAIANTANDKASADAVTEFEVRVRIINSSYRDLVKQGNKFPFRPGMTASVEIITDHKDEILAVPLAAVTTRSTEEENGGDEDNENPAIGEEVEEVVFLYEDGVANMIAVKTGISDYENIEILSGFEDTVQVVTGPFLAVSKRLEDGDKLEIMEKKGKKKE